MSEQRINQMISFMMSLHPVPYLHMYPTNVSLGQFVENRLERFAAVNQGYGRADRVQEVIIICGLPSGGKSYVEGLLAPYLKYRLGTLGDFPDGLVHKRARYEHGEARVINSRRVATQSRRPWQDRELLAADEELQTLVAEVMEDADVVTVEVPGITAMKLREVDAYGQVQEEWIGRTLGSHLFHDVIRHEGVFEDRNYNYSVIALMGGVLLRQVMVHSREAFAEARDEQEAGFFAYIYGKQATSEPLTVESRRKLLEGASLEQVEFIETQLLKLFSELRARNLFAMEDIKVPPLNHIIPNELQPIIRGRDKLAVYNNWQVGSLVEFILSYYGVPSDQAFIGFNNPAVEQLGLPDINYVAYDISRRRQQIAQRKVSQAGGS